MTGGRGERQKCKMRVMEEKKRQGEGACTDGGRAPLLLCVPLLARVSPCLVLLAVPHRVNPKD